MTGKTTIEWTWHPGYVGAVWNPTVGCTRVSAGCDNCYAFALHDKRYAANLDAAFEIAASNGYRGARDSALIGRVRERVPKMLPFPRQYDLPFSRVQLLPERLDVPLRTRKPTCYFVDSMADLFHEDVADIFIDRVFSAMSAAARHRFLILTKRPERMREYLSLFRPSPSWDEFITRDGKPSNELDHGEMLYHPGSFPLPNVWLGTSVEDQAAADERIPHLLATPAAVRFLSCEPLIGPVDLSEGLQGWTVESEHASNCNCEDVHNEWRTAATCPVAVQVPAPRLNWVIVGGESGPRARPMDLAWARSLVAQCRAAGVAVFVKQLGSKPISHDAADWPGDERDDGGQPKHLRESHGRDPDEWPEDLRVREWPL